MRYVNKGPLFIDVHMHKPTVAARTYMDSLLAFWPGIQVLKGDLKAAIEFHETLYQVIKVGFTSFLKCFTKCLHGPNRELRKQPHF